MYFDQFSAVKKEKLYSFTIHPIFSIISPFTLSNEKYWYVTSFFIDETGQAVTILFLYY